MAKTADNAENPKGKDTANEKPASEKDAGTSPQVDVEQPATPQPVEQPGQSTITIDDSNVMAFYANFCRVSSSPEELVLDLGLNPHPYGTGHTIKISQRIILNHYTAKRLLSALSLAVQRHEQAFGVLETDIRKRVRGGNA